MPDAKMDSGVAAVAAAQRHRPGSLRILLVDADDKFRLRLARRLTQQGHDVSSFSNCNDA